MTDQDNIKEQIRAELADETRRSRYRDYYCQGARVHPIRHDVNRLVDFLTERRRRQPGALDLAWRMLQAVDTNAMRSAVSMVLEQGSYNVTMQRRCARMLAHCDTLDAAFALLAEWKRTRPS